jgi:HD-GYP domain-containing protein (c-di-GMP phosphodiesterase class II)
MDADSELARIGRDATPRIVHDIRRYQNSDNEHSHALLGHGFASSYTHPIYLNGELVGFIFCNSFHNFYFKERVIEQIEVFVHLIAELILKELAATKALVAAMRTSVSMVRKHDLETGSHLERMARYARLIAKSLTRKWVNMYDDEQIELVSLFAPLHDIGKIAIPDKILQKKSRLDSAERQIMDTHTSLGRQIVDDLIQNFGFEKVPYIDYLRDITELHHESMDGSGYPYGLLGHEIAQEARIVAVSDVFDALTTKRPYKEAWPNEHAIAMLQLLSVDKLDKECVEALVDNPCEVLEIQKRFAEAA